MTKCSESQASGGERRCSGEARCDSTRYLSHVCLLFVFLSLEKKKKASLSPLRAPEVMIYVKKPFCGSNCIKPAAGASVETTQQPF